MTMQILVYLACVFTLCLLLLPYVRERCGHQRLKTRMTTLPWRTLMSKTKPLMAKMRAHRRWEAVYCVLFIFLAVWAVFAFAVSRAAGMPWWLHVIEVFLFIASTIVATQAFHQVRMLTRDMRNPLLYPLLVAHDLHDAFCKLVKGGGGSPAGPHPPKGDDMCSTCLGHAPYPHVCPDCGVMDDAPATKEAERVRLEVGQEPGCSLTQGETEAISRSFGKEEGRTSVEEL